MQPGRQNIQLLAAGYSNLCGAGFQPAGGLEPATAKFEMLDQERILWLGSGQPIAAAG